MKAYLILIPLVLFISSCGTKTEISTNENDVLIYGSMKNGAGSQLYVKKLYDSSGDNIDTIEINSDSYFQHHIQSDQDEFYSLINSEGSRITLYCSPMDSIYVEANFKNFNKYLLSGSYESGQINILNEATQNFLSKIADLSKMVKDSIHSPDYVILKTKIDIQYRNEFNKLKEFSTDFIIKNEGSLVSLLALSNQLGTNFFVFHPSQDMEIFYKVDSALNNKYPNYEPVEMLHFQIQQLKMEEEKIDSYGVGDLLPDFSLADTSGNIINLHSYHGNYFLFDVWASWCKICRQENVKFLELYKKYRSEGFEILQISLDESELEWKRAIEEDKILWTQLSDLKYWDSKVVDLFNISSIPFNYLVDSNGIIIARNLDGVELGKQLEILYKNEL